MEYSQFREVAIRSHNHRWDETGPELEVSDGFDMGVFDMGNNFGSLVCVGIVGIFGLRIQSFGEIFPLAQGLADELLFIYCSGL